MKVFLAVFGNADLGNFPRKFLATDFADAVLKAERIAQESGYVVTKSLLDEQDVEVVELN